ncbi:MAG TPA: kelch repeat-containing protein, partial [Polyangia bacterium]
MKPRNGAIIALLLLATCSEETRTSDPTNPGIAQETANVEPATSEPATIESARVALGKVPTSEVAIWKKVGASDIPDGRYLQAVAFDEARKVVVMFGGEIMNTSMGTGAPSQETWEWSTATGKWTNRSGSGTAPDARSGAAMVYDSSRKKVVLFGGRAGSGYDYEDTWEWEPSTGLWTDVTIGGNHPAARSQHAMVYEKSTGKVLLFGGGRSDTGSSDGTGITAAYSDTWEWDFSTRVWTPASIPP